MQKGVKINRRQFLKKATGLAGSIAIPYIIPSAAFGKTGAIAANSKITIGCIGTGWMGTENLKSFLKENDCQIVAVCDIDREHLDRAINLVNSQYGNKDCKGYSDFREVTARDDIDALSLGLPDHWHAIPAIEGARAGKDIYSEKPLSHDLLEGRAICNAVKKYSRIWQTGSWQRSLENFRFGCELVLNGRIGKVHTVEVGLPSGNSLIREIAGWPADKTLEQLSEPCAVPDGLDYDRWLGPAPYSPYCPARVHVHWRWNFDYGGGMLMDWIGHHADIANWGLGTEYTGPVEVEGTGKFPRTGLWNTPETFRVVAKFANGATMIVAGGDKNIRGGTKWMGDKGWVWVDRGDKIEMSPAKLVNEKIGHKEINLYRSPGHYRNFLDCIKTRETAIAPCEAAHRAASIGHLGNISILLGRKISFNPDTEEILNDAEASKMLGRAMRSPWHI
jgi:predicted dehydrogenase